MKTQPTKLAVLFPGIGYHCDKPLLYYAGKACKQRGYTVLPMPYGKLTDMDKEAAFEKALKASRKAMKKQMPWEGKDLLFISKSIGTVVASRLAEELDLPARGLLLHPGDGNPAFFKESFPGFFRTGRSLGGPGRPQGRLCG